MACPYIVEHRLWEFPEEKSIMEIYSTPLTRLGLSPRTLNALARARITRVSQVLRLSDEELIRIRNFGERCLIELDQKLAEMNLERGQ